MIRTLFFSLLIILPLSSSLALAQENADEDEDFPATQAYKMTLQLCSTKYDKNNNIAFDWSMLNLVKGGTISGFKVFGEDGVQLSKPLRDMINSRGYEIALDECYGPADPVWWKNQHLAFTTALVAADAGGHIVGILGWLIPADAVLQAFGRIFMATEWAFSHPTLIRAGSWVMKGANTAILAATAAYAGWDTYREYDLRKHAKEYYLQANQKMLEQSRQSLDQSYKMLVDYLAEINAELNRGVADPRQKQFLLDKKAQIEERLRSRVSSTYASDANTDEDDSVTKSNPEPQKYPTAPDPNSAIDPIDILAKP